MASLSNSEANSQTMPNTSNGLMRPRSHARSSRAQIYPHPNLENQLSHREYLDNCLRFELVQERLTQVPGKPPGPRCSDVKATLERVDDIWPIPHDLGAGEVGNTLNASVPRPYSRLALSQGTSVTCAQGIPGPSRGGTQHIHIAGHQPTVSSSLNPSRKRTRKRKKHSDDDDDNDDEGSPSYGKKPASLKNPRPKFACPFLKVFPHLPLHCHDEGGFADTSRVKEHIYRKHRNPQCPFCGTVFGRNEECTEHLLMRSCTPPENGFPILVIHNGQENEMRRRQGLRGLLEEEKWYRIYSIIFPEAARPYPSPYVEEHAGYQLQEEPRQPQELSHEVRQVIMQEMWQLEKDPQQPEQPQELPQELPQPPQGVSGQPQSVSQQLLEVQQTIIREMRQQLQEVRQAIRQEVRQVIQHEVRLQLQEAWRIFPPYFPQQPWQGDGPSLLGIGAQLPIPGNSSGENGHNGHEFVDPVFLQGEMLNMFEQVPEEDPPNPSG
ncbi:hypothetical protein F5Y00DRAFT_262785 [Daldinia vernicosa]|uniref:uncharacterized protein n=1 Tax=Daldinia vernicosa TaxID=114800 RepID=UPI00200737DA|nr:uncharacterized protein F5Y00DRAFT_262785 [Daldinia vernicosa]KAI0848151.1 hypothetical protein F5Y00DRAFT_262785 [Daldinia vernicosa]